MLEFASALYLGLRHPSVKLARWSQLTLGLPAALADPPGAIQAARSLARLQGCERSMLGPSTLHLVWDLVPLLADSRTVVYVEQDAYPIVRWGVERVAAKGTRVRGFDGHDPVSLRRLARRDARAGSRRFLVVGDGVCTSCGHLASLGDYLDVVREFGGRVLLDDSQALGIVGELPGPDAPYGRGGGGSLRRLGGPAPELVLVASLAKAFGVPLAAVSGSAEFVDRFESRSETRVHCSPPSVAVVAAARRALAINAEGGDTLRKRLAVRVRRFRAGLETAGIRCDGGLFPMQTLPASLDARSVHDELARRGIRAVLRRGRLRTEPRLSLVLRADHRLADVDYAVAAIAAAAARRSRAVKVHA